jgi:hypothetical protein
MSSALSWKQRKSQSDSAFACLLRTVEIQVVHRAVPRQAGERESRISMLAMTTQ